MLRATLFLLLAALTAATACSERAVTSVDMVPAAITKVAGDGQTATVQSAVAVQPAVLVENAHRQPVAGVKVTLTVASGGGSTVDANPTTDSLGIAKVTWVLGKTAGANALVARAEGVNPVTFTATGTAGPAAKLSRVDASGLSATVGAAIAAPPGARVTDAYDNPIAGLGVSFTVSAGGGSATGTAAVTDSLGVARVGSWTLGTAPGPNALTATVSGLPPLTITATGTAGPPAKLAPAAAGSVTGTVGVAVAVPPTVRVADAYDNPLQGVPVTFAVTAGGGTATGTSVSSDSLGLAAVGGWTLGSLAGADTLTATAPGLSPVRFQVIGVAGPPATIAKAAGDNQTANVRSPVDTTPAVVVRDAYGNPAVGVTVTFSVASGSGVVTGAAPVTDTTGTARVERWTLGPASGTNTLDAAVPALPPVIFTATAVDRCTAPVSYILGSSVNATLSTDDCRPPTGEYADRYSISVSGTTRVRLDMAADSFASHLSLLDANGALVASRQTFWNCGGYDCPSGPDSIRVLLAAGTYVVQASGFNWDYDDALVWSTGPYTLSSAALPEDVHSCSAEAPTYGVPGLTTTQHIDTTDCMVSFRSSHFYFDRIYLYMTAGRTYTISMSSAEFDTYLELWLGTVVASNDDFGGSSNSQITFTPTSDELYVIEPATYQPDTTGSYTLTVTATDVSASAVRSAPRAGGPPRISRPRGSTAPRNAAPAFTPRPPKAQRGG